MSRESSSSRARSDGERSSTERKSFDTGTSTLLRSVLAIDAHVFGGEVAAPDRRGRVAGAKADVNVDRVALQDGFRLRRRLVVRQPVLEQQHAADTDRHA